MKYSIVILTYNRAYQLEQCLKRLFQYRPPESEIIVIDNSNGASRPHINLDDVTYVSLSKNYGVWARNIGFDLARGEFIVQIDDDVVVTMSRWYEVMSQYFSEDVIAVGQQGILKDTTWASMGSQLVGVGEYCDILTGYMWMMRNRGYRYDNYWRDHANFWHEESELQFQMRSGGWRFKMCPPVASHASARTDPVNWEMHNKALEFVTQKWKPEAKQLRFERS